MDDSSSRFRSVYKSGKRWKVQFQARSKQYYLGTYDTAEEASKAYAERQLDALIVKEEEGKQTTESSTIPRNAQKGSRFRCVYKSGTRWRVQYQMKSKHHYLGVYDTEEAAAKAYDRVARLIGYPTNFDLAGNEITYLSSTKRKRGVSTSSRISSLFVDENEIGLNASIESIKKPLRLSDEASSVNNFTGIEKRPSSTSVDNNVEIRLDSSHNYRNLQTVDEIIFDDDSSEDYFSADGSIDIDGLNFPDNFGDGNGDVLRVLLPQSSAVNVVNFEFPLCQML